MSVLPSPLLPAAFSSPRHVLLHNLQVSYRLIPGRRSVRVSDRTVRLSYWDLDQGRTNFADMNWRVGRQVST